MIAWKLFRQLKNGEIAPLFINKKLRLEYDVWYPAESHPTKGFSIRPGWHVCSKKSAPHLSEKGRVWRQVEIEDYQVITRPANQGGIWYLANKMRVLND
jgi:hypothetical protein